ncbi:hypothetical protein IW140_000752 [Coemansia sp. RSA 1813]|nr:hypothetical protein EV178_000742 [Coemansia sp. RSA 1646]KAJ1773622.1 hypothetical protein LPJ74_000538 [Coemansia sp. RSA 1843]KAJ2092362.1 hypothetical protein IW138_001124 [Coemansia sp. RSA 986]KAJ2217411.1 hypothetical protein EV179_000561 [Coemansia sp. RSA 487]KAJ2572637.1 hypothetical protein IW140_000752 [Coemansia sp. RSA 1813]
MTAVNIPKLKVKPKKLAPVAKCATEMAALATCWASASIDDKRCAETSKALSRCIQKAKRPQQKKSDINFHLARLGKQVLGK